MSKILIIEDDSEIAMLERDYLEIEGFETTVIADGEAAAEEALRGGYDLLLLDLMLPGCNGYDICRRVRDRIDVPILMVTARTDSVDKIRGLGLGADDYIAKPFSVREVLARVRSVLRRTAPQEGQSRAIAFEGLHMDLVRKICTVDGTPLALTKKEFEILALLLSNRGRIFSREEILHQVWSDEVIVLDRTIDVNITRLRRKIGVYGDHIVTRLGYGYGFEE